MSAKRILIAGVQSGVGKTTVTLSLMAALAKRGLNVRGFKVGPDYLDPTYYRQITGQAAYNLDGWMTGKSYVRRLFASASREADISVVEGAMGLYDGFGGTSEEGSSAQIAKWIDAPVLLVVDARGMSRSAGAVIKGFVDFDKKVDIAGVVFNNIGSERHLSLLREAVFNSVDIAVVGGFPRDIALRLYERHLGLVPATEGALTLKTTRRLAVMAEKHLDIDFLITLASEARPVKVKALKGTKKKKSGIRIGVALDDAFNFYYQDNFNLLERAGAELVYFSPLKDHGLPERLSGLILGGGFPECFAEGLSSNKSMLTSVRSFAKSGRPVYAECGGLIYISKALRCGEGRTYPMAGIFPFRVKMLGKRQALGYVDVSVRHDSIIGKAGTTYRGHEFHYSAIERPPSSIRRKTLIAGRSGKGARYEGFSYKNVLATYVHAHFGSQPMLAVKLVAACGEFKGHF